LITISLLKAYIIQNLSTSQVNPIILSFVHFLDFFVVFKTFVQQKFRLSFLVRFL